VVAGALLAAVAVAVLLAVLAWHAGVRLYAVRTGSMTPTYPIGSVVVDAPVESPVQVGDVITFRTGDGLVTHRVVAHGAVGLKTKGDANRSPDPWTIPTDYVRGTVVAGIPYAGYALVFLQQPTGRDAPSSERIRRSA
jgi:signal peptidase